VGSRRASKTELSRRLLLLPITVVALGQTMLLETPLFREQEMRREIAAEYLSCWRGESNAEPSLTDAR